MVAAVLYVLALTVAEIVTVFFQPVWGISVHALVLTATIVHAAAINRHPLAPLVLSLTLVPLVRIMSLSMPLTNIPQIWWYPIIYAPLMAAAIAVMRLLGQKPREIGVSLGSIPVQLVVALSGILLGIIEYLILSPEPMISGLSWGEVWLPALILFLTTGLVEEFIFRGIIQYSAMRALGNWGIVYSGVLFAVLHIGFLSWLDVIFVFVVAVLFGWIVKKTGSLFGVTLAHGLTNTLLFLVVPFLLN